MACFHGNLDALQNGLFKLEIWRGEEEGPVTCDGEEGEGSEEGSDAEEPNEAGDREVHTYLIFNPPPQFSRLCIVYMYVHVHVDISCTCTC